MIRAKSIIKKRLKNEPGSVFVMFCHPELILG